MFVLSSPTPIAPKVMELRDGAFERWVPEDKPCSKKFANFIKDAQEDPYSFHHIGPQWEDGFLQTVRNNFLLFIIKSASLYKRGLKVCPRSTEDLEREDCTGEGGLPWRGRTTLGREDCSGEGGLHWRGRTPLRVVVSLPLWTQSCWGRGSPTIWLTTCFVTIAVRMTSQVTSALGTFALLTSGSGPHAMGQIFP